MPVNLFGIDVNWDAVRSAGDLPPDGTLCSQCALPMQNIIGQFAEDSYQAGTFALHFLAFLAAAALAGYWYWTVPPKAKRNFFGLRIALLFFVASRLLAWIYLAIANSLPMGREFFGFWLVPNFFQFGADVTLLWTLTRTALQPMVLASRYARAKGVGLGLTIPFGLVATAAWLMQCWSLGIFMQEHLSEIVYWGDNYVSPSDFLTNVIYGGIAILWGIVIFALSIRANREAAQSPATAPYCIVPKLMIATSIIWIVREGFLTVAQMGFLDYALAQPERSSIVITPLILAIFTDIFGIALFAIFFLAYRDHLAPLYNGNAGYLKQAEQNNGRELNDAASERTAIELENQKQRV